MIRKINLLNWWMRFSFWALPLVFFSTLWSVQAGTRPVNDWRVLSMMLAAVTVVWVLSAHQFRMMRIQPLKEAFWPTVFATSCTVALLSVLVFLHGRTSLTLETVFATFALMLCSALCVGQLFRGSALWMPAFGPGSLRLAVVGHGQYALDVAEKIRNNALIGGQFVCFVKMPGEEPVDCGHPSLDWASLDEVVSKYSCNELLVAMPPERFAELPKLLRELRGLGLPSRLVLEYGEGVYLPEKVIDFAGIPVLDFDPTPAESFQYVMLKRVFDVLFSASVLLAMAPAMLVIALLVKTTSSGPVFFLQERVGFKGRRFKMIKFRTMRTSAPESSDRVWTVENDPRRTWIGSFLRKTSLDEMPQFINVLKGEMSVVGPRPERPFFVQQFMREVNDYNKRHSAKVGITGWAQINGWRGDTCIAKRVEHDLQYLKNWSMIFDLRIIALTIVRCVKGAGY